MNEYVTKKQVIEWLQTIRTYGRAYPIWKTKETQNNAKEVTK